MTSLIGSLIAAWLDIRSRPLRTLAAIAGMVAAVVAVVLVNAASVLSHDANNTYLARQYGLPITASISSASGAPTVEQALAFEQMMRANGITAFSRDFNLSGQVTYRGQPVFHAFRWVSSAYQDVRIVDLVAGSWPTDTAHSDQALHAVIVEGQAQQLLGISDQAAVGTTLGFAPMLGGTTAFDGKTTSLRPVIIDGVVKGNSSAFMAEAGPLILVSDIDSHDLLLATGSYLWQARINPEDFTRLQQLVASFKDANGSPLLTARRLDSSDTVAPVLNQQDVTARVVSIVALTIGGLGIFGVGLAGVRERSKDFGLRRALGANRLRVFGDVIIQTLLEVLLAALVAIPLAAILLDVFARDLVLSTLPIPPSTTLPMQSALLGLAGALVVGLVAGLLPAIQAARSSVVQALRG
ncbi:MAG: ABC transporter permease [Thermomicrobiales bacterium]